MKKILLLCATHRDKRELYASWSKGSFEIINGGGEGADEQLATFDPLSFIDKTFHEFSGQGIDGVLATDDYPGCIIASIIAKKLNLPAPEVEKILLCQHKYYSRIEQRKIVPEAVPNFELIDADSGQKQELEFPFFVKPVKSFFSVLAQKVEDAGELRRISRMARGHINDFVRPFNQLLGEFGNFELNANYLIAEELLEGKQVTVEGFVHRGKVTIMGVVDSVMFPGTICFKQFDYPSKLPKEVQTRMELVAEKVMRGIGFDNGIFNIEMIYEPEKDRVHIVEINPRMASQFADLFEKVDGVNTYQIQVALSLGEEPHFERGKGRCKFAGSFVFRRFKDAMVEKAPGKEEIKRVHTQFPDARVEIFGTPGKRLSEDLQDGKSYRYRLVNLGGNGQKELINKYERCKEILKFEFGE
ncbi:ATP-grasp domain-containing protein [Candidatus Micrarchaeota archaeon]|nr:ATP-grasp domain-containing protein [Candidatus Micrarchaeota archaeon]